MKAILRVIILAFVLWTLVSDCAAQGNKGIRFDRSMSWEEVVEKAMRENKYIFMDVMATWCGPCRNMAELVFPNEEVGEFFNRHFISVKLQMNKTAQDDEYTKAWYKDVERVQKLVRIQTVPTLLFFNPKGELVHAMPGATTDVNAFIDLGKIALDENRQLFTRWRKFKAGERDVDFLYDLSVDFAVRQEREYAMQVANVFWQTITPEERLSEKGIRYASDFIFTTNDETFKFFLEHSDEVDAVLGKGSAMQKALRLIEREMISPYVKDSINMPDWKGIYENLCMKYPQLKDEFKLVVTNHKMRYAQRNHKDDLYLETLLGIVPMYGEKRDSMQTRGYAHILGVNAKSQEQRDVALDWLKKMQDEKDAVGMAYYAEVLFLSGQKEKGRKYIDLAMRTMSKGTLVYTEVTRINEKYVNNK